MGLRSMLDAIEPHFEKGGKFEALYPAYEAIDTALYTPDTVTAGASHIRDGLNLKRIMITVWAVAFIPALAGAYATGHQANAAMAELGLTQMSNWREVFVGALTSYDPGSVWDCVIHGLSYFLPLYITVFLAGIIFEIWFASKRGHEVNEGLARTS